MTHDEREAELRQCLVERWAYAGLSAPTISLSLDRYGFKPPSGAEGASGAGPSGPTPPSGAEGVVA